MPKPPLKINSSDTVQLEGISGFMPVRWGISPKVNVIARLEFKLSYFEAAVQHGCHYATGTPSFGWVSLFNGISTFVGYLMPNEV